jgi:hypothetical protein
VRSDTGDPRRNPTTASALSPGLSPSGGKPRGGSGRGRGGRAGGASHPSMLVAASPFPLRRSGCRGSRLSVRPCPVRRECPASSGRAVDVEPQSRAGPLDDGNGRHRQAFGLEKQARAARRPAYRRRAAHGDARRGETSGVVRRPGGAREHPHFRPALAARSLPRHKLEGRAAKFARS